MNSADNTISTLVETYKGPKLSLLFTGCGARAAEILAVPGASEVLYDLHIPYAREAVAAEVGEPADAAVSAKVALQLHNRPVPVEMIRVTATAAITSTRYRRGDNHAYIVVDTNTNTDTLPHCIVWHLKMEKMEERLHSSKRTVAVMRQYEDALVCDVALLLATQQTAALEALLADNPEVSLVQTPLY